MEELRVWHVEEELCHRHGVKSAKTGNRRISGGIGPEVSATVARSLRFKSPRESENLRA